MSADKHRSLARRIAWLRLGAGPFGFATGIEHAVKIDADILRLERDGLLARQRRGQAGRAGATTKPHRKTYTAFTTTEKGHAVLAETLAHHGETFGPSSLANGRERQIRNKSERQQTAARERAASDRTGQRPEDYLTFAATLKLFTETQP